MFVAGGAAAQVVNDPVGQSVREPADLLVDRIGDVGLQPGQRAYRMLLVPGYSATNGSSTWGATLGLKLSGLPGGLSLQARGIGHVLNRAAGDRNRVGADVKLARAVGGTFALAVKAAFVRTSGVSDRADAEAAADVRLLRGFHSVKAGVSARYRSNSPASGPTRTGSIIATGASWSLGGETELQAAYAFDNEFSNEDDFTMTFSQVLPQMPAPTVLMLTAGKHRYIAVNLAMTFRW